MPTIDLNFSRQTADQMQANAVAFYDEMQRHRSARDFAPDTVPQQLIAKWIQAAGCAPSAANQQP